MDSGTVAVEGIVIGVAGCKVEASFDLFVEERILHGEGYVRVHTKGKFANIAGPFIRIEDGVELCRVVRFGFDDLAVFKLKVNVFKGRTVLEARRVVRQIAVDGILHRRGVHFPIGNVHAA